MDTRKVLVIVVFRLKTEIKTMFFVALGGPIYDIVDLLHGGCGGWAQKWKRETDMGDIRIYNGTGT